ncbi:MAG: hypothetical protein ACREL7_16400 [Longimicrobiales bacterium]
MIRTRQGQTAAAAPEPAGDVYRKLAGRIEDRASALARHPVYGPFVRSGLVLGIAVGFETVLMRASRLPATAYEAPFFATAPLRVLAGSGMFGLLALGIGVILAVAAVVTRSTGPRWSDFEHVARMRWLIGALAAVLAWVFASYDYNYYFDQSHGLERALLIALVPLVVWRPVFTLVFLAVLFPIGLQFAQPIGGFSWAPASLPVRVLVLFSAWWLVRLVTKRVRSADVLFVLCCLIAAHYWVSGWEKLGLGWVEDDRIGFLVASTYANGWLGFLDPATIGSLVRRMLAMNVPMKAATLLIECGALFMLWRRATVRWFLVAAIGLHIAIFLLTGIGFWQWVIVDALVLLLFFRRTSPAVPIFTQPRFLLSLVLIGFGAIWFRPTPLAWLDARATYTYRFEAVGENGRTHPLPPAFFSPYDYQFTLGAFRYLVDAPRLPVTWGATNDRRVTAGLNEASSPDRILELEAELGRNDYDAERARTFERFVAAFVGTWQGHGGRDGWLAPLQAPASLWTFPRSDPALGGERIERVIVYEVLSFFDGARYVEIRKLPIREIPLDLVKPR